MKASSLAPADASKPLGKLVQEKIKYEDEISRPEGEREGGTVGSVFFGMYDEPCAAKHNTQISFSGYETDPFFHNAGGTFVDISTALGTGVTEDGRGAVWADFDGDGDQDIVMKNVFRPQVMAFRNELGRGRSVDVHLRGTKSNRFAVGARVVATIGGKRLAQDMTCGSGYLSSLPYQLHWGLGDADAIEILEISWPSGIRQKFEKIGPGRVLVDEDQGIVDRAPYRSFEPTPAPVPERIAHEGDRFACTANSLDGKAFNFDELKGKALVVQLWSANCKSCDGELRAQSELIEKLKELDEEIRFISMSVDGDLNLVTQKLRAMKLPARPLLVDRNGLGLLPRADPSVPLTIVVGTDGIIKARHVGAMTVAETVTLAESVLK